MLACEPKFQIRASPQISAEFASVSCWLFSYVLVIVVVVVVAGIYKRNAAGCPDFGVRKQEAKGEQVASGDGHGEGNCSRWRATFLKEQKAELRGSYGPEKRDSG